VKIVYFGSSNPLVSLWRRFSSLDLFTKLAIVSIILFTIATYSIVRNYQLFNARGETQAQELQSITRLQQSQEEFKNVFARTSVSPSPEISPSNSDGKFNLLNAIYKIFISIIRIFK
jgi:hypothetical protein